MVTSKQRPSHTKSRVLKAVKQAGMGAIPYEKGVAFRVWAPHAESVSVIGTFNDWNKSTHPMQAEDNGFWYVDIAGAKIGDEYLFVLKNGEQELHRIDPYARQVTNSVGHAVVADS